MHATAQESGAAAPLTREGGCAARVQRCGCAAKVRESGRAARVHKCGCAAKVRESGCADAASGGDTDAVRAARESRDMRAEISSANSHRECG
eukprot:6662429-Prymnesium_polylepis.1